MPQTRLSDIPYETWALAKPPVRSSRGIVVAQEVEAARVGARVIEEGGNAVDGAVATALALCVTEPWMSGLGGGGFMLVHLADERRVRVVDFGMIAPAGLKTADYPLTGAVGSDMFGWPAVADDVNLQGPKSVAVPGSVSGYAQALSEFGTRSWQETCAPAVALARRGHRVTWWTTLNVASEAAFLRRYPESRSVWLPNGLVPAMAADTDPIHLPLGRLAETLETLAEQGPQSFYEGALAQSIVSDLRAAGCRLSENDLSAYRARVLDPLTVSRGDSVYSLAGGLTAGPTFADALSRMPEPGAGPPGAMFFSACGQALTGAYRHRLETMGHAGDVGDRSCTTHISTADGDGNMVMMTTTLLSRFGSRLVLPGTGILMNNGINWFDPRPGRPNSMAPGRRPLSNMCPMIATGNGEARFGFGASGGRRIMPAVFQLAAFVNDCGLDLETAMAQPRIDVSGISRILYDGRLDTATASALASVAEAQPWTATAAPALYAVPSGLQRLTDGIWVGAAHIHSPAAAAVAVSGD